MTARFYSLSIAEVRRETDNAVCLTFQVPEELQAAFKFTQGQYLTLLTNIDGSEVRRSYSICSGVDDERLSIGIKQIEGGAFSTFANRELKPGDLVDVMSPQGEFYTVLDENQKKNYMCICAGSGITPILSIVKSILSREPESRITLLYGNRNSSTIMFKEEIAFLKNRYMSRFNWLNILSREQQDAEILCGRLDNSKGQELHNKGLINIAATDEFFLCGPESMISEVSRGLRAFGVPEEKIHYELFFASAEDAKVAQEKRQARAERYGGKVSQVEVTVSGRTFQFDLAADGENILDGALRSGADLPFSCRNGVCATCKARVLEGEVEMDLNHSLTPQEIEAGMILTCQSHPVTPNVKVDFDQA